MCINYERGIRVMNRYVCNSCGKELREENGILQEDALIINKEWGYFSHKDLELHNLVLCEECYDQWVSRLQIPVTKTIKTEVLGEDYASPGDFSEAILNQTPQQS